VASFRQSLADPLFTRCAPPEHGSPTAGSSRAAQHSYDGCMAKGPHLPTEDEILTAPAAAQIAGLDRAHFRRLIREGKGPVHQTVRAGKRDMVLILRRDLDAWIKARNA